MNRIRNILLLTILLSFINPALAIQNLDKKIIMDGGSWNIGNNYYIMVNGVDHEGEQAFVSIWNEGELLHETLMKKGDKFEYRDSSHTLIVSLKLSSVFRGKSGSSCHFSDIFLRYGEPGTTSTTPPTPTPVRTATAKETPAARETVDVDFGSGALIPGVSMPAVGALLILAMLLQKRNKKQGKKEY